MAHLVELRHMRGPDEDGVLRILELHLDAHLGVPDHQLGIGVRLLQLEQGLQARGPAQRQYIPSVCVHNTVRSTATP